MPSLYGFFNRKIVQGAEAAQERALLNAPDLHEHEELASMVTSPTREVGELSDYLTANPHIEYAAWLGHVTRNAKNDEHWEMLIRRKAARRLRQTERAPVMVRAQASFLGAIGLGAGGLFAYTAVENFAAGKTVGGIGMSIFGVLIGRSFIKDGWNYWHSSAYEQALADRVRERGYYAMAMARLDQRAQIEAPDEER